MEKSEIGANQELDGIDRPESVKKSMLTSKNGRKREYIDPYQPARQDATVLMEELVG